MILDVEIALNNRPLSYVEDDIQLPVLTPNSMMFEQSNVLPEKDIEWIEGGNLRKRARYLRRCKDALWSRWSGEYVKGLRERHNLNYKTKQLSIKPGDVVLMTSDERNRGKWNIGVVVKLIKGRDGVAATEPEYGNDPGLWNILDITDRVREHWIPKGPSECQHHDSDFQASERTRENDNT